MTGMRSLLAACAAVWLGTAAHAAESPIWSDYLDYAYVYSSSEPEALRARLDGYGQEAGISLERYLAQQESAPPARDGAFDEGAVRRRAIGHLLHYLAEGEPDSLDGAVDTIRELEGRPARHENRYWHRYILAHRALEKGRAFDFVGEVLDLWLEVVVPLESPYDTLETLSLSDSPNSGFVAALPYLYENVARLILIKSQQMGLDRHLDPLAALVRMLHDGRVGTHPEAIPPEASSAEYVARIVERLSGPDSDAGSLTFTLALFEASRHHDRARGLLASEDFSDATLEAIRVASGAYETALHRARTEQGRAAVYTRVLRQLGEIYAAKQRLGEDPDVETPFSVEGAIEVYNKLAGADEDGWAELGFARVGRPAYVDAMHRLWEEIQEATLNAADYYLTRAAEHPHLSDEQSRNAARLYARYLAFFRRWATPEGKEAVPESAYFAAYEAARGFGDAFLVYGSGNATRTELEEATRNYVRALQLYPFDRHLWPALTAALERQGRGNGYLALARPVAESAARSRALDRWIAGDEAAAESLAASRRALSDGVVMLYLGFAESAAIEDLEASLVELEDERAQSEAALQELSLRREALADAPPARLDPDASLDEAPLDPDRARADLDRLLREEGDRLAKLEEKLAARTRALPLYRETFATDALTRELRARRDHPVHALLRRMYHETRSLGGE